MWKVIPIGVISKRLRRERKLFEFIMLKRYVCDYFKSKYIY